MPAGALLPALGPSPSAAPERPSGSVSRRWVLWKPCPFRGRAAGRTRSELGEPEAAAAPRKGRTGGPRRGLAQSCRPTHPRPASRKGPTDPTLRANPCPEVTDQDCRFPLPTLIYRLEASHLGDLMRRWVQSVPKQGLRRAAGPGERGLPPLAEGGPPREPARRPGQRPV